MDRDLRRIALANSSQQVDSLRLRTAFANQKLNSKTTEQLHALRERIDEDLREVLEQQAKERTRQITEARMKYQAWALEQIEKLNESIDQEKIEKELYSLKDEAGEAEGRVHIRIAEFGGVREMFEKELGGLNEFHALTTTAQKENVGKFVKDNWYEIVYQVKHDAAVRYLLPIDQGLLELPVAKFYNKAFEEVWEKIQDGDKLQLSLARKTAEVPKRTLESFMEEVK